MFFPDEASQRVVGIEVKGVIMFPGDIIGKPELPISGQFDIAKESLIAVRVMIKLEQLGVHRSVQERAFQLCRDFFPVPVEIIDLLF